MKELEVLTRNNTPTIIAITEVNPKSNRYNISESEIKLEGYNLYYKHTINSRGVAIYIHNSLIATILDNDKQTKDSIWLEIKLNNSDRLIVGCVYRSPSSTKREDELFLDMIKDFKNISSSHMHILGDFNFPKINWTTWESSSRNPEDTENKFLEGIQDAYFYQYVTLPTRGRLGNKPSIMDLVLTNEEGMVSDLELWSPLGKSDHSCLSF